MRDALGWVAIALVLVGLYVYRHEIEDVALRVSSGLVPGRVHSQTDSEGRIEVVLHRRGGDFRAQGNVNGIPTRFLIDTGASLIALTREDAEAAGIHPDRLVYSQTTHTANGPVRMALVELDSVGIGGIRREGVNALVAPPGALGISLLGMNFLSSLSRFEFRDDRITLND